MTKPTINAAFEQLQKLGIVEEITKKKRGRVYAYREYLAILNEGGEPLDGAGAQKMAGVTMDGRQKKTARHRGSSQRARQ